jgi:hypothetical protein
MTANTAFEQAAKKSAKSSRGPREQPRAAQNSSDLEPMSVDKKSRRR